MSLPVPSWKDIKKWVAYWRKFKGKKVRIWFDEYTAKFCVPPHIEQRWRNLRELNPSISKALPRKLATMSCVDGIIDDVIDSPIGILVKDVIVWRKKEKLGEETVVTEITDIKKMFVPFESVGRIDFPNS